MDNRIRDALAPVQASPALKARTRAAVAAEAARRSRRRFRGMPALAAACALALVVGLGGLRVWSAPLSSVSVDVNPSLELALNRWDRVVEVRAYNTQALAYRQLGLTGRRLGDALDLLLAEDALGSYLGGENPLISITVQSDGDEKTRQLLEAVSAYTDRHLSGVRAVCAAVDRELVREAHARDLSPGKYRTLLELLEADPDATLDQWRDRSMGELHDHIDACHRASGGGGRGQGGPEAGGSHGHGGGHRRGA